MYLTHDLEVTGLLWKNVVWVLVWENQVNLSRCTDYCDMTLVVESIITLQTNKIFYFINILKLKQSVLEHIVSENIVAKWIIAQGEHNSFDHGVFNIV